MSLEMIEVYLGLGSNLGDRQGNLDKALELLSQRLRVTRVSSTYETEPVDMIDQPRFLNSACQINTSLAPMGLLALAKGIESKLGRAPSKHNASRPIDIDILLYGDQVIDTPELVIPHARLVDRAFVLIPLAEIAPDVVHPITGKTVKELLKDIAEVQGVFKWEDK